MASRVWEAMAPKPRRFDLTMSRRTRRPPSLGDQHQAISMEGSKTTIQPQQQEEDEVSELTLQCCPCSLHNSEDAEQHKGSEQTEEQAPPQKFSLQELIQDETLDGTATGDRAVNASAAADDGHEVAEASAEAADAKKQPKRVAGRKMIGMVRRYVRVRSTKSKNVAPIY